MLQSNVKKITKTSCICKKFNISLPNNQANKMEILTKRQAAEIIFRPISGHIKESTMQKCVDKCQELPNYKFIKEFRKSTYLKLCSFAPNKYIIRY